MSDSRFESFLIARFAPLFREAAIARIGLFKVFVYISRVSIAGSEAHFGRIGQGKKDRKVGHNHILSDLPEQINRMLASHMSKAVEMSFRNIVMVSPYLVPKVSFDGMNHSSFDFLANSHMT